MAQARAPSTASLIRPLRVEDVLISDEVVMYNERFHWAILIQPFLETVAVLVFITLFAGGLPTSTLGAFIILFALVMVIAGIRRAQWRRSLVYLLVAALLIGFVSFGLSGLAIWAIIITTGRFIYLATMWAFYRRLYITNRRLIRAFGFLGAKIASMPLTRLTDLNFDRSVPGEILGYGTLRVETAGQDQALSLLRFVDRANIFYAMLISLSTAAVGSKADITDIDTEYGEGTLRPESP